MREYTITEIAKLSGLSRKDVRKHLIAQTLKNQPSTNGYKIDENELNEWIEKPSRDNLDKINSAFDCVNDSYSIQGDEFIEINIGQLPINDNWTTNILNGIKFADFFSGAGGLSLGLVLAGFEPVLGVEIDKEIYQTYKNNLGRRFNKINKFNALLNI